MRLSLPFYRTILLTGALSFLLCSAGVLSLSAQSDCGGEPNEIPWVVPSAIASVNGDLEIAAPAIVYIGDSLGRLQKWELSLGTLTNAISQTPGDGLPANVKRIWDIATLSSTEVIALVTYSGSGGEWYGFMRSSDAAETWSLVEPAALRTTQFASVEGKRVGSTDWTGNYFRAPLSDMEWLKDGMHGWAYGRQGIVRTTDGGATWSVAYDKVNATPLLGSPDYSAVWGLAMRSPSEGVAVIGARIDGALMSTTDGGENWRKRQSLTVERLADLEEVGGEYRALLFNGQEREQNGRYLFSEDGASWTEKPELQRLMKSETVYPTEALWVNRETGFVIQRRGEIWRTDDEGDTWELVNEQDSQYDSVEWGDGTSIAGNFRPPFYAYAGYGQRTVIVRDDFGDPYFVQVLTETCSGKIRPYVPAWFIEEEFNSVPGEALTNYFDLSVVPNPANTEECHVGFSLEHPARVTARLVDARGVEVKKAQTMHLEPGQQGVTFDVETLPSGIYRVLLSVGDRVESRAIVIAR